MENSQVFAFCQQEDMRFGVVYFRKGRHYPVTRIHDILLFKGEQQNWLAVEEATANDWFLFHFRLVFSLNPVVTPVSGHDITQKRA